jgi:ribosomal protein S18 acetylase RimI-like enzyme
VNIRAATKDDLPALIAILRRSWLTVWAPELPFAAVQRFAATDPARHYAEEKWQDFFVAEADGVVVGMFHLEGDHLHAIHLDPARKRSGIGSALMDDVEHRIAANHTKAKLEVRAFNTGAIAFYKQRGWVAFRSYQDTECGEPVETIEMIKDLAER